MWEPEERQIFGLELKGLSNRPTEASGLYSDPV